jgi:hypothetical protein
MLAVCFVLEACAVHREFDEAVWRALTMSRDRSLLYAPHHNENGYFNPWLPNVERKGSVWDMRMSERIEAPHIDETKYGAVENEYDYLAANDLGAGVSIPMYFGIVELGKEPVLYPPYETDKYMDENPAYKGKARVMRAGEHITLEDGR